MKLIVLDFQKDITYVYTKLDIKWDDSQTEKVLYDLGHNPTNCQWMITKNEIIIKSYLLGQAVAHSVLFIVYFLLKNRIWPFN